MTEHYHHHSPHVVDALMNFYCPSIQKITKVTDDYNSQTLKKKFDWNSYRDFMKRYFIKIDFIEIDFTKIDLLLQNEIPFQRENYFH